MGKGGRRGGANEQRKTKFNIKRLGKTRETVYITHTCMPEFLTTCINERTPGLTAPYETVQVHARRASELPTLT